MRLGIDGRRPYSWDAAAHRWLLRTGLRQVWVGPSSAELPLHASVEVAAR